MPVAIPDSHRDLLEKPLVVVLATITPDGKPHAVPIWRKFDGEHLLMAIDHGSQKHKNILSHSYVSVVAVDPANPYRYLRVDGVAEAVEEGALELLDELARFYLGVPEYFGYNEPLEGKETYRGVVLKITPQRMVKLG
ncbi:MAG: PPOX class F420-dependent oxidoreductase [Anaerolineae bacterium]|nr:PPOX class F420-dependent oxidoreductase [Anaerolineae bacterium]